MRNSGNWPCRDCYDRKPGCQDHCEVYISHRNEVKALKDAAKAERDVAIMTDRYEKEKRGRLVR